MTQVKDLTHLQTLCQDTSDFFIVLRGGLRSSKNIYFDGEVFEVIHEIDWSEETITAEELPTHRIGEALEKGALYAY